MACFSWAWVENLLIGFVIVCVIIASVKVLVPAVMNWFGAPPGGGAVMTVLGYIAWGVLAIFVIIFVFELLGCLMGGTTGFRFPR